MEDYQGTLFDLAYENGSPAHHDAQVVVGTSGYSFQDWKGAYYPHDLPDKKMLEYYARDFNSVEINASYYRLMPPRTYESMLKRVPKHFTFAVKVFQGVTHEKSIDSTIESQYEESIQPLAESGRLVAVLLQFPWSFRNTDENRGKLIHWSDRFSKYPLLAEFRNDSWDIPKTTELLQQLNIAYCCVDEPALKGLMPTRLLSTRSDFSYVRLHGRNAEQWWNGGSLRYDYLYKEEELKQWGENIANLTKRTARVFAFFNNCHLGQAVKNARMLKDILKERGLKVI
jgi:uncharacterized protein YecE (DUF72 family)